MAPTESEYLKQIRRMSEKHIDGVKDHIRETVYEITGIEGKKQDLRRTDWEIYSICLEQRKW